MCVCRVHMHAQVSSTNMCVTLHMYNYTHKLMHIYVNLNCFAYMYIYICTAMHTYLHALGTLYYTRVEPNAEHTITHSKNKRGMSEAHLDKHRPTSQQHWQSTTNIAYPGKR